MPSKFAPVFRACCVMGVLLFAVARAADQKTAAIGATREQVVAQFGVPKSHIVAGDRELIFYPGQKLTLRDNVVIEVEEIPIESAPPPAPPPAPAADSSDAPASPPAPHSAPTPQPADASKSASNNSGQPSDASGSTTAAARPAPPPVAQIISVRPPSKDRTPPSSAPMTPAPAKTPPATVTPTPTPVAPAAPVAATEVSRSQPSAPVPSAAAPEPAPPVAAPPAQAVTPAPVTNEPAASAPTVSSTVDTSPQTPVVTKPQAKSSKRRSNAAGEPDIPDVTESIFTPQTYVIAALIIGAGVGYLVWRSRERRLALAATAVSRSPFVPETTAATVTGTRFTPELLARLEWKRFEELVASYYNKTGVVAARTKAGPASPVHIRISWKGESRPFACVQCISHPVGLVEAKQIQALVDAIAAEDIRRGYVVTTGKFGVPARDLSEEKHITLLSGDILIEKLNALPEAARSELMRDATVGDYTTPSCSTCDVKMARSPADPSVWQCPQCGTVLPKA
jgi:hypothetical protein